jgi:hypothetical protein
MRHRRASLAAQTRGGRWSTKNLSASTVRLSLSGWYVTVRVSTPLKTHRPGGAGRSEVPALARAARRLAVAVAPAGPRVRQSDSGSPHRAACATRGPGAAPSGRRRWGWRLWSDAPHPRRQGHWHWHPAPRTRGASMLAALPRCALGLRASLPVPASVHGRASRPRGGREGHWQRGRTGCQCLTAPPGRELEPSTWAPGCSCREPLANFKAPSGSFQSQSALQATSPGTCQ